MVNAGGKLAPGNPLGVLTISNSLTLAAGSTTFVQVQPSPLTNDLIKISGTFAENGTLNVTNSGGTFSSGDNFKLISAQNFSGAFANFILPTLAGNLVWNTNSLKTSGILSVVALAPPVISSVAINGGNFSIAGSAGAANWPFVLCMCTNLAGTNWTPVSTNQFDASGNFNLSRPINPNLPQTFYRLQLQ